MANTHTKSPDRPAEPGLAFGYNVVLIPMTVLDVLNPILAGAATAFSSVSVVTNSLRLYPFRPT